MRARCRGAQIGGDAAPDLEPLRAPRGRGIDAEQVHAAQDERHDRGLELRAAREPDAGDVAPEIHLAREPREHLAADVVDGARVTRGLERPAAELQVAAQHHLASA